MQREKEILNYTSEGFNPALIREYQLVIDGIAAAEPVVAFFDEKGQLMHYSVYSIYESKWPEHPLQTLDLLSVRFTVAHIGAAMIPTDLYDQSSDHVYQRYIQGDGVSVTQRAEIKTLGIQFLYKEYLMPLASLIRIFPDATRTPFACLWLEWLRAHLSESQDTVLALHFGGDKTVYSAVYHQNKLFYYSVFHIHKEDYLMYLLLKIFAETGMNPSGTKALLSGNIERSNDDHHCISNYIEDVQYVDQHRLLSILLVKI